MSVYSEEIDPIQELEMTRLTVAKLLSEKKQMGMSMRQMRFQLMTMKKDYLKLKTSYVVQKTRMRSKIVMLKKEIKQLQIQTKLFMSGECYLSDENGVIDISTDTLSFINILPHESKHFRRLIVTATDSLRLQLTH